jgi:hypothetical protein
MAKAGAGAAAISSVGLGAVGGSKGLSGPVSLGAERGSFGGVSAKDSGFSSRGLSAFGKPEGPALSLVKPTGSPRVSPTESQPRFKPYLVQKIESPLNTFSNNPLFTNRPANDHEGKSPSHLQELPLLKTPPANDHELKHPRNKQELSRLPDSLFKSKPANKYEFPRLKNSLLNPNPANDTEISKSKLNLVNKRKSVGDNQEVTPFLRDNSRLPTRKNNPNFEHTNQVLVRGALALKINTIPTINRSNPAIRENPKRLNLVPPRENKPIPINEKVLSLINKKPANVIDAIQVKDLQINTENDIKQLVSQDNKFVKIPKKTESPALQTQAQVDERLNEVRKQLRSLQTIKPQITDMHPQSVPAKSPARNNQTEPAAKPSVKGLPIEEIRAQIQELINQDKSAQPNINPSLSLSKPSKKEKKQEMPKIQNPIKETPDKPIVASDIKEIRARLARASQELINHSNGQLQTQSVIIRLPDPPKEAISPIADKKGDGSYGQFRRDLGKQIFPSQYAADKEIERINSENNPVGIAKEGEEATKEEVQKVLSGDNNIEGQLYMPAKKAA